MLLLQLWISVIVLYNFVSGVLAIYNPLVLDALFPGSAELFGTTSTMFSRVLGSYALSIAGIRLIFVICPKSREAFYSVLWTFFIFESMFVIEIVLGEIAVSTVAVGIFAGTISVVLMLYYKLRGYLDYEHFISTTGAGGGYGKISKKPHKAWYEDSCKITHQRMFIESFVETILYNLWLDKEDFQI